MAPVSTSVSAAVVLTAVRGWRLFPCRTEIDRAVMAAHPAGSTGCRWLMPAAEMAGLAGDGWRSPPDPDRTGWPCPPRIATVALGAQAGSVRAARDFTVATLRRWGTAHSSQDIAIVVSELLTNALRHALLGPGGTRPRRPVRLGLLQQGPWVLCAVADPGTAAPVPRTPGSLAEAGRGLQTICAFSDLWGTPRQATREKSCGPCSPHGTHRLPRPGTRACQAATRCREQHADDRDKTARVVRRAQSRPGGRRSAILTCCGRCASSPGYSSRPEGPSSRPMPDFPKPPHSACGR